MSRKCHGCDNESDGPRDIEFFHKVFKFSVFKVGGKCPDCAAEQYRELFDKLAEEVGFISGAPENPAINWDMFRNIRNYRDRMRDLLLALGIFSRKAEGNWCIVSDGEINLNPSTPFTRVFFARLKDAADYARLEYANTLYGWEIRHISGVLPKNVVLDKAL